MERQTRGRFHGRGREEVRRVPQSQVVARAYGFAAVVEEGDGYPG